MSLHAAIKSHLLHHSKVALLVDDRVYHMTVLSTRAPKRPYIVFQVISQDRWRHMSNTCGVVDTEVQINIYADKHEGADAAGKQIGAYTVAEEVRKSLDHLNHRTIGRAPDSLTVNAAFLNNSFADYTVDPDGREWGAFRVVQEWRIVHEESLPVLAV